MPNVYFRFNREPPKEIDATTQVDCESRARLKAPTGVTLVRMMLDREGMPRDAFLDELPYLVAFKFDGVEVKPDEYGYSKAELMT